MENRHHLRNHGTSRRNGHMVEAQFSSHLGLAGSSWDEQRVWSLSAYHLARESRPPFVSAEQRRAHSSDNAINPS